MTAGWWAARAPQLLVALVAAPALVIGTGMLAPGDAVRDRLTAIPVLLAITGLLAAALTAARPLLPIAAAPTATAAGGRISNRISTGVSGRRRARRSTPYAALVAATTHLRAGCLERALPGVAAALAGGTAARGALIWLAVGEQLVATAGCPSPPGRPGDGAGPVTEPNLAVVLSRPDTTLAAPVLDNADDTRLRAVLTIDKPTTAITATDRALLADVATAASLLLRRAAQNADYTEQLRQAKDLAAQADASRQRLASADELARRRLITELNHLTAARFTALRRTLGTARDAITALTSSSADPDATLASDAKLATDRADRRPNAATTDMPAADVGTAAVAAVRDALHQARVTLDQLLARFRIIARGVYPAVLRDEGPAAALGELITDLPCRVQVTGGLGGRLEREVEAGLYYVAAAALQQLARTTTAARLSLHLQHADRRVSVLVHDPAPTTGTTDLTAALCDDVERLAALGGAIELRGAHSRPRDPRYNPLELRAWLPDRLEPVVETPPVPPPGRWAPAPMVEVGNPPRAGREDRAELDRAEPDRAEPGRAEPDPAAQGSGAPQSGAPESGEPDHGRPPPGAPPVSAPRGGLRRRRTRRSPPPRVAGRATGVTRRILVGTAVIGLVAVVAAAAQLVLVCGAALVLGDHTAGGGLAVPIAASVAVALALLPLYRLATRVVDRLLYGHRPDPYRVLAQVTAAAGMTFGDTPDLVRLTHALGEALDARACRLTVRRPGLSDRAYNWTSTSAPAAAMVEVSIRYGPDIVGSLAVDEPAVAGAQRRHRLLHDIADSLAVVVEANRTSVDVERQLREALAHADDIAVARRSLVADMERERRRIERDLHDGVQGHLVSLAALTALVDHQVAAGQLPAARQRLEQIAAYLDVTESILDQTVQEVSHPLHRPPRPLNRAGEHHEHHEHGEHGEHGEHSEQGEPSQQSDQSEHSLIAALRHAVDDGHPAVVIDADLGVDVAIAPPIAAAIYYCCLEAINNARTHAQPDTIALRVSGSDGRLRFTVTDDGIGYDAGAHRHRSSGRGLRNVRARLATVGGHVDIHSQPECGTTVDAAVPLTPAPLGPADDAPADVRSALASPWPALGGGRLFDRVRDATRDARELYHGSACAHRLRVLADRLDQPPRIGITTTNPQPAATDASPRPSAPPAATMVGAIAAALQTSRVAFNVVELTSPARPTPRGGDERADIAIGVAVRVECLNAMPAGSGPNQPNIDDDNPDRTADGLTADAGAGFPDAGPPTFRVLTRPGLTTGTSGTDRPPAAAGPTGAGGATDAGPPGDIAEPVDWPARAAVEAVVAVDAQLATMSAALTEQHFQRLRHLAGHVPGSPVDEELTEELGPAATRLAVQLLRGGPTSTRADLVQQLATASGLTRLVELVEAAVGGREEAVVARAVLGELEQLVRDRPPAHGGQALRYELERIRAGSHELTELDLVDALRVGQLRVPDAHRNPVLRMLGGYGGDPRTRLGLPANAHPARLPAAAAAQREHWHRLATHPAATAHLHTVATAATYTCDQLLGRA